MSIETRRERLAKAAEELADECEKGTAPEFGARNLFRAGKPCCAFGHVMSRAGLPDMGWVMSASVLKNECGIDDRLALDAATEIEDANDLATGDRQKAVIAPLRKLAAELRKA